MNKIADRLTRYIIKNEIIDKEDYETYRYGMQTGLEMTICMALCTFISIYLKLFLEFAVLVAVFFSLRAYVGGLHLRHFLTCLICSCLIITLLLLLARSFTLDSRIAVGVTVITLYVINLMAPLATKDRPQDQEETAFFAKQRRRIYFAIIILDIAFAIFNFREMCSLIMYTIIIVLFSMILGLIKRR